MSYEAIVSLITPVTHYTKSRTIVLCTKPVYESDYTFSLHILQQLNKWLRYQYLNHMI